MPDIFLSYSRTDLAIAGQLAAALQAAGHDVWWDQALKAGEVYDRVTEAALREARAVVVLWSKASVQSDWVRSEATVALQRGALVPVMIEDCQRPVMFELRQSADLIGWKGNRQDPRLAALLADVARQLGVPTSAATIAPAATGPNRRLLIGGAVGVAALAAGGFGAWKAFGGKADDGTASVMVLPFANLSGDPAQAYFSDGIAEELRNALSKISGLKVIGRVTSEQFRDAKDLSAAAEKLGVDYVLTGSVRRSPTTIRIGAQLVDGRNGVEGWSQIYDQPAGDSLAIQSKIATSVVAALSQKLAKSAGVVAVGGTNNPQAQELFLKGRALVYSGANADEDGTRQLLAMYNAATDLDPNYADPWAAKGMQYINLSRYSALPDQRDDLKDKALAASQRAVALAPKYGFARASLAIQYLVRLDIRRAVAEAGTAAAMASEDANALINAAAILRRVDPDRALLLNKKARDLDPYNPLFLAYYASGLYYARQYAAAAEAAKKTMALSNNRRGLNWLTASLLASGQTDAARVTLRSISPEATPFDYVAIIAARTKNPAALHAALKALREREREAINYMLATVHAQGGETEAALLAIEASLKAKEADIADIAVDPFLDPIRGEPRFKAVQDTVIPPDLWVPPKRA